MKTFVVIIIAIGGLGWLFTGCQSQTDTALSMPPTSSADHGRVIYQTQCTACHNADPHKPGSIGPDVFGSSKVLLEARILRAQYPDGYKPKRNTHAMSPLPHLKNEIDSLYLFLNGS